MILALKLLLTPLMISIATLTGRRWGPAVSGWLIGFPFTSGPVSIILAYQNGVDFAAHAATGALGGQLSVLSFCLVYSLSAVRLKWSGSLALAVASTILVTVLANSFTLSLLPTFAGVVIATLLVIQLIPQHTLDSHATVPARWDIPARMVIATSFVFLLTTFSNLFGPLLSGLIEPFPIYGIVLATFAHYQQGDEAARQLLRGVAFGSFAFASFFLVTGGLLPAFGMCCTYLIATLVTLLVNGGTLLFTRRSSFRPVIS